MDYIVTALISYLFGSIPFGYLFTKILLKKDIRNIGSGNIGATNVLRTGNKSLGYLTLILDIAKAVVPVIYIKFNYPDLVFISALCAFLGHLFPIWLKFKGGKGVATGFGIILCFDLLVGILSLVTWLLITKLFKISSLSALVAYFFIPIFIFLNSMENNVFISSIIISCICFFKHTENIKRLLKGSEPKI